MNDQVIILIPAWVWQKRECNDHESAKIVKSHQLKLLLAGFIIYNHSAMYVRKLQGTCETHFESNLRCTTALWHNLWKKLPEILKCEIDSSCLSNTNQNVKVFKRPW